MKLIDVRLEYVRSTMGLALYAEVATADAKVVGHIYLKKSVLGGAAPKVLRLTIAADAAGASAPKTEE